MLNSQYKTLFKFALVLLLCALILPACSGQMSPDGWAGPTVSDNILYVISQKSGEFLAIDLSNANSFPVDYTPKIEEKSSSFLGCQAPSSELIGYAVPVIYDGIAYITDYEGKIYAVNLHNRTEAWPDPVETDGPIVGNSVVYGDSLIVPSGSELFSLNLKDGSAVWNKPFKADGDIWSNLAISGDMVYFGTVGHKLYAVNADSGQLLWEKGFDGPVLSTPIIEDGTVFIGTFESKFYALDAQTGAERWDEPFQSDDWFWTTPAYKDRVVYVGCLDKKVYAIDAATGKAKWNQPFETEGTIRSAAVIVENPEDAGDTVLLVASKTGSDTVYGINLETGAPKWASVDLGGIYADPFIDETTGTAYYLNRDNELLRLNALTGNVMSPISIDTD